MDADVLVVGAGMAGLTAAGALAPTRRVVVLDKGRGVGGRVATRRIGDATLDHGAQFLTTHGDGFARTVAGWAGAGVVRPWFHRRLGPDGAAGPGRGDGHVRWRGAPAMTAVAKHLAAGLDVRTSTRVGRVVAAGDGWDVRLDDGGVLSARAVLLTAPVPQSLELIADVVVPVAERLALEAIRYDPCLAALVPLDGPAGLPEPGAVAPSHGPVSIAVDNRAKGVSAQPALTVHATPGFSRDHWDAPDADVVSALLDALGRPVAVAAGAQVMRWRYARPVEVHPQRCVVVATAPPLVLAGDAFGGPHVEGAVRSGEAAARLVADLLDRPGSLRT
jgi:predicted NAD/FAD-dependent oxidoreductase